jgi:hypothetical protein
MYSGAEIPSALAPWTTPTKATGVIRLNNRTKTTHRQPHRVWFVFIISVLPLMPPNGCPDNHQPNHHALEMSALS